MPLFRNMETFSAAILFAAIFYFGIKLHLPAKGQKYYRRMLSFSAGCSVAYVFIHLLPELQKASETFIRTTEHLSLPFPELRVFLSAMVGFLLFYGLEHMVNWSRISVNKNTRENKKKEKNMDFLIQVGGFSVYVWLVSYLLVGYIEKGDIAIVFYAVAMGVHFLSVEQHLRMEYGKLFERTGRKLLALACLLGWGMGILINLPLTSMITLLGFISGAVIINAVIMELPKEKEGKFLPFLLGSGLYTLLLLWMG